MTAALLGDLARFGISVDLTPEGNLHLKAERGVLTPERLETIKLQKSAIVRALLSNPDEEQPWDRNDWQHHFDERAGIIQFDGGYPRDLAERCAIEECIHEWRVQNPPPTNLPNDCAVCGTRVDSIDHSCFEVARDGRVWGHRDCEHVWLQRRRDEAIKALRGFGISVSILDEE